MKTPKRYTDAKYEDISQEIRTVFERMSDTRQGLYIHGGVGTGKTHVAYALANHAVNAMNKRAKVYNVPELLREIKLDLSRPYQEKLRTEEDVMEYPSLLILDDIGSERMSEWVEETFYLIINRRYSEIMPTIFMSNLTLGELAERVGDRTASRIAGMCEVVEIKGNDRRLS